MTSTWIVSQHYLEHGVPSISDEEESPLMSFKEERLYRYKGSVFIASVGQSLKL
jgi:hypothetical protein